MGKTFRFQLYSALPNLVMMVVITILVLSLTALGGSDSFFSSYYTGLPLMYLILAVIFGSNLSMAHLHVGLSMGAQRRGYFAGTQLMALVYTAIFTLLYLASMRLPDRYQIFLQGIPFRWNISWWLFAAGCFAMTITGMATGFAMARKKKWTIMVVLLVLIAMLALLMGVGIQSEHLNALPLIAFFVLAALTIVFEVITWKNCKKAVVR